MWIVILNFCLFILLIGFMLYGFHKWSNLITEYNDGSETRSASGYNNNSSQMNVTDAKYHRLPIWILMIGIGISQLISFLQKLFGY